MVCVFSAFSMKVSAPPPPAPSDYRQFRLIILVVAVLVTVALIDSFSDSAHGCCF